MRSGARYGSRAISDATPGALHGRHQSLNYLCQNSVPGCVRLAVGLKFGSTCVEWPILVVSVIVR